MLLTMPLIRNLPIFHMDDGKEILCLTFLWQRGSLKLYYYFQQCCKVTWKFLLTNCLHNPAFLAWMLWVFLGHMQRHKFKGLSWWTFQVWNNPPMVKTNCIDEKGTLQFGIKGVFGMEYTMVIFWLPEFRVILYLDYFC